MLSCVNHFVQSCIAKLMTQDGHIEANTIATEHSPAYENDFYVSLSISYRTNNADHHFSLCDQ
jgi:hypothetical protein